MSTKIPTIADEWREFQAKVVPPDAPPTQIQETRRAFYAGQMCMFAFQMKHISSQEDDDVGASMLWDRWEEMEEFVAANFKQRN